MDLSAYNACKNSFAFASRQDLSVLALRGTDAIDFLDRISTNDMKAVRQGACVHTVLTSDKGRVIDVVSVVPNTDGVVLIHAAKQRESIIRHLRTYIIMDDVRVVDCSSNFSVVECSGPRCVETLNSIFGTALQGGKSTEFVLHPYNDVSLYILATTALCEISYLCVVPSDPKDAVESLVKLLRSVGSELSEEEFESLRLESGRGTSGRELTPDHNPLEANLLHLVNFKKGCYIGQEVIARLDSYNKVKQRLVGFVAHEMINAGATVNVDGVANGVITSSVHSPDFGFIALGYIRTEYAIEEQNVELSTDASVFRARIVQLPFH